MPRSSRRAQFVTLSNWRRFRVSSTLSSLSDSFHGGKPQALMAWAPKFGKGMLHPTANIYLPFSSRPRQDVICLSNFVEGISFPSTKTEGLSPNRPVSEESFFRIQVPRSLPKLGDGTSQLGSIVQLHLCSLDAAKGLELQVLTYLYGCI